MHTRIQFLLGCAFVALWFAATAYSAQVGTLLFRVDFERPELDREVTWKQEGQGRTWLDNGRLHLQEVPGGEGIVLWLRRDWPESLRLSFTVVFSNNRGIGVIFIAAGASGGGHAFDDTRPRTGAYDEYIRGDLDSYSLSLHRYWPDGRNNPGSNLRRNSGFHLLDQADPDPVLNARQTYRVSLEKRGNHLKVLVDGALTHEAIDDGKYGPAHGAGKIGFRLRGDPSCVMTLEDIRIEAID